MHLQSMHMQAQLLLTTEQPAFLINCVCRMPSQDAATKEQLEQLSVSLIDMEQVCWYARFNLVSTSVCLH